MLLDTAYQRFFKRLSGKPHIKARHKFKSFTLKQTGWKLKDNRITLTLRKYDNVKWKRDFVSYHKDLFHFFKEI